MARILSESCNIHNPFRVFWLYLCAIYCGTLTCYILHLELIYSHIKNTEENKMNAATQRKIEEMKKQTIGVIPIS